MTVRTLLNDYIEKSARIKRTGDGLVKLTEKQWDNEIDDYYDLNERLSRLYSTKFIVKINDELFPTTKLAGEYNPSQMTIKEMFDNINTINTNNNNKYLANSNIFNPRVVYGEIQSAAHQYNTDGTGVLADVEYIKQWMDYREEFYDADCVSELAAPFPLEYAVHQVSWEPVAGATQYMVEWNQVTRARSVNAKPLSNEVLLPVGVTTAKIHDILKAKNVPAGTYIIGVAALNANSISEFTRMEEYYEFDPDEIIPIASDLKVNSILALADDDLSEDESNIGKYTVTKVTDAYNINNTYVDITPTTTLNTTEVNEEIKRIVGAAIRFNIPIANQLQYKNGDEWVTCISHANATAQGYSEPEEVYVIPNLDYYAGEQEIHFRIVDIEESEITVTFRMKSITLDADIERTKEGSDYAAYEIEGDSATITETHLSEYVKDDEAGFVLYNTIPYTYGSTASDDCDTIKAFINGVELDSANIMDITTESGNTTFVTFVPFTKKVDDAWIIEDWCSAETKNITYNISSTNAALDNIAEINAYSLPAITLVFNPKIISISGVNDTNTDKCQIVTTLSDNTVEINAESIFTPCEINEVSDYWIGLNIEFDIPVTDRVNITDSIVTSEKVLTVYFNDAESSRTITITDALDNEYSRELNVTYTPATIEAEVSYVLDSELTVDIEQRNKTELVGDEGLIVSRDRLNSLYGEDETAYFAVYANIPVKAGLEDEPKQFNKVEVYVNDNNLGIEPIVINGTSSDNEYIVNEDSTDVVFLVPFAEKVEEVWQLSTWAEDENGVQFRIYHNDILAATTESITLPDIELNDNPYLYVSSIRKNEDTENESNAAQYTVALDEDNTYDDITVNITPKQTITTTTPTDRDEDFYVPVDVVLNYTIDNIEVSEDNNTWESLVEPVPEGEEPPEYTSYISEWLTYIPKTKVIYLRHKDATEHVIKVTLCVKQVEFTENSVKIYNRFSDIPTMDEDPDNSWGDSTTKRVVSDVNIELADFIITNEQDLEDWSTMNENSNVAAFATYIEVPLKGGASDTSYFNNIGMEINGETVMDGTDPLYIITGSTVDDTGDGWAYATDNVTRFKSIIVFANKVNGNWVTADWVDSEEPTVKYVFYADTPDGAVEVAKTEAIPLPQITT